ncbi:polymeric immunoglobulin receptor-like isoform X2 [Trachinotus anak]|uniref:polymeric immunoglobulin receptor-like isoform X2 n=1 Tax=Trachinotus anak TaxID=443729 RepID=UPI0039F1A5D6
MAVHLRVLLILSGLTGIHSITTVNKVSVKAGGSITIPCLYGSRYMNHVKYLCKGYHWRSCSYAVKTNPQDSSGKFSISDNKNQRIFTVTIKDLTDEDTHYWCVVEINGGADTGVYFHLSVTRDMPSLYVDRQEITGFNGGSINISCYSRISGETGWCRLGRSCVTGSSGSIDGTSVTISARDPNVFTVTMSGLTTESSGWYLCHKGDLQMPVHVTVAEKPNTTTSSTPGTHVNHTDDSLTRCSDTCVQNGFIIALSLLIVIVMMTLLFWFVFKKVNKQTEAESSATATAEDEVKYSTVKHKRKPSKSVEDVTYTCVKHMKKPSHKGSDALSDVEVIYSSVVRPAVKQQKVKVTAEDVTYSRLAQQHQYL